jgi:hypothetical protein
MNRRGLSVVAGPVDAPRAASATMVSISTEQISTLVFRVRSGKLNSVSAVRDAGIRLEYDGDLASRFDLLEAYIQPGHARTCIAEGLVALGAAPYRDVTLDGEGSGLEQLAVAPWMLAGFVESSYVKALVSADLLRDRK